MGRLTAMRIAEEGLAGVVLVDIVKGLAQGKAFDLEDARAALKYNYNISPADDLGQIRGSDIIVITAGVSRKPGMLREELLNKNAQILKEISLQIKKLAQEAVVIIVTNPLDLMTYLALEITGSRRERVFGMGVSLDSARFANLIAKKLNLPFADIDACVVGSHGEGMLPLSRFTKIKDKGLDEVLDEKERGSLIESTKNRGQEIVSLLASSSAYFAPSACILNIIKCIVKDEKKAIGISAYLDGEYGLKDVCIGVPCRLGSKGIEEIIELPLNKEEFDKFLLSAESLKKQIKSLPFN